MQASEIMTSCYMETLWLLWLRLKGFKTSQKDCGRLQIQNKLHQVWYIKILVMKNSLKRIRHFKTRTGIGSFQRLRRKM
ncbi:uncharacterized protein LOC8283925 isoform X3 [Ricinus communis]|uniref:uncharacterized protein LOC8283925 isoform X3 n=1 Tax=Ricinus communis TaxID=3988 RepID=UPI00201AD28F|nr:uncharacterized protein LOC8283925 isoform X3 [Ricinus communis]